MADELRWLTAAITYEREDGWRVVFTRRTVILPGNPWSVLVTHTSGTKYTFSDNTADVRTAQKLVAQCQRNDPAHAGKKGKP